MIPVIEPAKFDGWDVTFGQVTYRTDLECLVCPVEISCEGARFNVFIDAALIWMNAHYEHIQTRLIPMIESALLNS